MTTSHTKEPVNVGKESAHTLAKLGCKLNEGQQMLLIACSTTWFSELVRQRGFYQQQNAELLDALKEINVMTDSIKVLEKHQDFTYAKAAKRMIDDICALVTKAIAKAGAK